jgi:hypothetical protein
MKDGCFKDFKNLYIFLKKIYVLKNHVCIKKNQRY